IQPSRTDNANPAKPELRRAPILRVINRLSQNLKGPLRKHPTHLRNQRAVDGPPQQSENLKREAFANLERDVANESIAHDHVHVTGKKISAFDIADKMHGTLLQPSVDLARQFVALNFFFTD